MALTRHACEKCGAPALVHITNDEAQGATIRRLCLGCADAEDLALRRRHRDLNYGTLLLSVGGFVLILSLFADWFAFGVDAEGFGWKQGGGVILAGVLVTVGAIVQVPAVLLAGLLIGALTILADLLAFGHAPGFGLHQAVGTCLGMILIAGGLRWSYRNA